MHEIMEKSPFMCTKRLSSIFRSTCSVNGIPACANHKLLTEVLRAEWGFQGYVISDQGALEFIISNHHYINNSLDTAVVCMKAGCNLELSTKGWPVNYPTVYLNIGRRTSTLQRWQLKTCVAKTNADQLANRNSIFNSKLLLSNGKHYITFSRLLCYYF